MKDKKKLILFCIIFLLLGVLVGVMIGLTMGINTCVDVGLRVLERQGFELDPVLIQDIINRYGSHI